MELQKELEKKKTQMRRGILELCVLGIIAKEEVYTSDIIAKLKQSELIVVEGTLYPLLSRLKNADLLKYTWKESVEGPPRKYFQISEQGQEFLQGLLGTWKNLNVAVENATKKANSKKTK